MTNNGETKPTIAERYPEHTKQSAIVDKSQAIGEFLEFSGYILAELPDEELVAAGLVGENELQPVSKSLQQVLAEYFEIDLNKIEQEKREMLDELNKHMNVRLN